MSGSSDHNRDAYPTANIVVGVGRVGLAALEQIGGEWSELSVASDDPTLKNLRLVHVRPDDDGRGRRWREQEREYVRLAKYTGDDDRPSRALDFVILRSLGIVRFHDGAYQVAIPRDEGVVERDGGEPVARRRYFEWKHLSPDPIGAAERLAKADDDIPDLERFAEPLLNRVKLGHSPQAVLASISRCRALSEGRDPSPWRWICDEIRCADLESGTNGFRRVSFDPDWLEPGDRQGVLENFAQAPVRGWEEWFRSHVSTVGDGVDGVEPELSIPDLFVPRPSDLEAPLEPLELLKGDWEKSGWATDSQTNGQRVQFRPAEVSEFRLGLFDHDDSSEVHRTRSDDFAERLRELSVHAHRGLVRLWVDLQRNRVESPDHTEPERRRRGESS
ncbi:MAG: hypothetical protein ABEL76_12960, partial [Bradymonadaceae bacterium]